MTMLERIARAITPYVWDEAYGMPESLRDHVRMASLVMARAAVEAMRVPDENMQKRFYAACDEFGQITWKSGWQAMLDAILNEEPTP